MGPAGGPATAAPLALKKLNTVQIDYVCVFWDTFLLILLCLRFLLTETVFYLYYRKTFWLQLFLHQITTALIVFISNYYSIDYFMSKYDSFHCSMSKSTAVVFLLNYGSCY